jgi:hypothetical protein
MIPASVGELVDKITILEIKLIKLANQEQLTHVSNELLLLQNALVELNCNEKINLMVDELKQVNLAIWILMDSVFAKLNDNSETLLNEMKETVELNIQRSRLKRLIDVSTDSTLMEAKSYFEIN